LQTQQQAASLQVWPQPAAGQCNIRYTQLQAGYTQLQLLDLQGRVLHQLISQENHPGTQQHQLTLPNLPAGVYLLRLQQPTGVQYQKIQLQ
jgi:hypothetical protein